MPLNMYRIALVAIPNKILRQNLKGYSNIYKTIRYYSKNDKKDLCPPKIPKPGSAGAKYAVGTFALLTGGIIAYANYDPNFRSYLNDNVPFSDKFFGIIFQEERTIVQSFIALLDAIKSSFLGLFLSEEEAIRRTGKSIPVEPKIYNPPSPAFSTLAKETKEDENLYSEIRVEEKKKGKHEPKVTIGGDQKSKKELPKTHPKSILELETTISELTSETVQSYNKAVYALKNYNNDVQRVIEDSVERLDPGIWDSLRQKTKEKQDTVNEAESLAKETKQCIKKLKDLISSSDFAAPSALKQQAELNMAKVTEDINIAQRELEIEKANSNITEKYWKRVEDARNHFINEIEILFPTVDIAEKKMELQGGELDLFILHAFSNVLYYQKELYKIQTVEDQKVKSALEYARRGNKELLTDAQIDKIVQKEKLNLEEEFKQRCLCLRIESEKELRRQLKMQSTVFSDHLSDALQSKEAELQRAFIREIDQKVTEERCKFKLQLSALAGRVRGMDQAIKDKSEFDKTARQAQVLWSACQALFRALRAGCAGLPWREQIRPLDPEISAITQAAAKSDELVKAVVAGIPKEAKNRGVYPEDALRERFLKVEKVCRQLSLVPEGGARLPLHLLSYLQAMLLLKAASPIPQCELEDKTVNFTSLNTNEILQRARYWLDRGDFAQTLRYMNLLKGAPRCVARQWMNETRILLETQQAASTLMAHAAASGLMYL